VRSTIPYAHSDRDRRPICPRCSARMWLARINEETLRDKRTFECAMCGNSKEVMTPQVRARTQKCDAGCV